MTFPGFFYRTTADKPSWLPFPFSALSKIVFRDVWSLTLLSNLVTKKKKEKKKKKPLSRLWLNNVSFILVPVTSKLSAHLYRLSCHFLLLKHEDWLLPDCGGSDCWRSFLQCPHTICVCFDSWHIEQFIPFITWSCTVLGLGCVWSDEFLIVMKVYICTFCSVAKSLFLHNSFYLLAIIII